MPAPRTVLSIGSFDGVHAAHAALVRTARGIADSDGARVVILSFDPHPATTLRPESAPPRLTTFDHRAELLCAAGADEVVRLEPTRDLLSKTPDEFIGELVRRFGPIAFVEGPDFHFGHRRSGTIETLRNLGQRHGFAVHVQESIETALSDHTIARISSTMTRWLLEHGRIRDAAILLGRDYSIEGTVVQGDRRGRGIGFPTANIDTPCLIPADGVYAGIATLPDGRRHIAAISIGTKPTFTGSGRALEAYLLDVPASDPPAPALPGLPEYGWIIRIAFAHWLRDQARYGSIADLVAQMHRDCDRARALIPLPQGLAACP